MADVGWLVGWLKGATAEVGSGRRWLGEHAKQQQRLTGGRRTVVISRLGYDIIAQPVVNHVGGRSCALARVDSGDACHIWTCAGLQPMRTWRTEKVGEAKHMHGRAVLGPTRLTSHGSTNAPSLAWDSVTADVCGAWCAHRREEQPVATCECNDTTLRPCSLAFFQVYATVHAKGWKAVHACKIVRSTRGVKPSGYRGDQRLEL